MASRLEVDALNALFSNGGVRTLTWITEGGHPQAKGIASMTGDYQRLMLGVMGRRTVSVFVEGRAARKTISPGDCLVMGPRTWLVTEPSEVFFTLGVALEARNPRLVLTRTNRRGGSPRTAVPEAEVKVLPGLCDDTTMTLAAALQAARSASGDSLYVRKLAETLWARIVGYEGPSTANDAGKANVTYSAAEHFVREHFGRAIDREEVAKFLRVHPSHVTRLFLRFAGESFGSYLLRVRLESARALLRDPRLTVSEIAYLSGFASPNYFVRAYRQRYRITPGRDRSVAGGRAEE